MNNPSKCDKEKKPQCLALGMFLRCFTMIISACLCFVILFIPISTVLADIGNYQLQRKMGYQFCKNEKEVSNTFQKIPIIQKKSPTKALLIASFAGGMVWGTGHRYAGSKKIGKYLLIAEGVMLTIMSAYILSEKDAKQIFFGGDLDPFASWIGIAWTIDIIGAPILCIVNNSKIESVNKGDITIKPIISPDYGGLVLSKRF